MDPLSVPVTRRITIESPEKVAAWHSALLVKPAGVLYEDSHIQIGVKHKYAGGEGQIVLFMGNKEAVPLVAVKIRIPDAAGIRATVGDAPSQIGVRAQVQVPITAECVGPFSEAPQLLISFISAPGTGHAYALRLPVSIPQYCEPAPMAGADYRTRWVGMAGAPKEVTAIVKASSGAEAVSAAAASKAVEQVCMASIDAGAAGATGASLLRTKAVNASGAQISVPCLAMIIPDAANGAFKVAVRTGHPEVSKAVMTVLQTQLSAL